VRKICENSFVDLQTTTCVVNTKSATEACSDAAIPTLNESRRSELTMIDNVGATSWQAS
jgi:hypothetical protein